MERVSRAGCPLAVIDYAHTPDALDKALAGLRPLAAQRGGRLWCVFGCGGDRDPIKRPMMAAVAEKQADRVVVTSDNPRSEKPEAIISQILRGFAQPECGAGRSRPRPRHRARHWRRPRPRTWCSWPARATRPSRRSRA